MQLAIKTHTKIFGKRPSKRPSKTNAIIKKSKIMLAVPERRGKKLSALEDELGSCRGGALTARTMILILCRILYHVGMKSTRSIAQSPSAAILLSWLSLSAWSLFARSLRMRLLSLPFSLCSLCSLCSLWSLCSLRTLFSLCCLGYASIGLAQPVVENQLLTFDEWVEELRAEALSLGIRAETLEALEIGRASYRERV